MATTRADAVIDGIVATLRAYSGLSAPGGTGVWVYDGPEVVVAAEIPQEYVAVGWDGDIEGDGQAVDVDQDWHDMGPGANRDESGKVTCILEARPLSTDDADFSALRTRAVTILGYVEAAVRADPDVGVTELIQIALSVGSLYQGVDRQGAFVRIPFVLGYTAIV